MGEGKYRNLAAAATKTGAEAVKHKLAASTTLLFEGHTEAGKGWEKEKLSFRDYCRYHVLIALIVLIVVVTTVTLAIVLSPTHVPPRDNPNILVIIADDLGYNDLGYYNEEYNGGQIRTPYIDKLAKDSIRLERHYVQPMCSPSRAAFFTGRYPFRYGMGGSRAIYSGSENGLNLTEELLPKLLQDEGYKTYLIGKWHLGFASWAMTPVRRGFDYFYGTYGGSTTYYTHKTYFLNTTAHDLFEDRRDEADDSNVFHSVVDDNTTFTELLFTDKAIEVINNATEKDADPFFLVMSYMNPHAPIEPMEQDLKQNTHIANEARRKMASMITSLDYGVGRIVSTLENTQLLNNTIIVFFSDNGGHIMMLDGESLGSSNYPLRGAKCTLYEGGVRSPAFIRIPQYELSNHTITYDGLVHATDWLPTIATLAGIELDEITLPHKLDGIDHSGLFKSLLREESISLEPRDHVILDIDPVYDQASVIAGNFKLVLGNPAALNFSNVYPLLEDNVTHYSSANETALLSQLSSNAAKLSSFMSSTSPCLSITCISNTTTLYDISVDTSENYNLSWRFPDITEELHELLKLYANETAPLVKPVSFEDWNDESRVEYERADGDTMLVWTPWS